MLRPFLFPIHIPGTLSANIVVRWKSPMDCTLQHVSAVATNDSDALLKIGTSADDDIFLQNTAIGDSGVPVELSAPDSFRYLATPRIRKGDIVVFTVDFDGAAGTAAQNVTVVAAFEEG